MKRLVFLLLGVLVLVGELAAQDSIYGRKVVARLSSPAFKGRGYSRHGDLKAARYIRRQMRHIGLSPLAPHYFQEYRVNRYQVRHVFFPYDRVYTSQNVCGVIPGEVDTIVAFTAHYDHLGIDSSGVLYPGAHDNASGVAAVLELARMAARSKPHYTLAFLLFSGEEAGILGSRYCAGHPPFDCSKVRLLVNLDMFCGGDEGLMVVNADSPETVPFVDRMDRINAEHHYAFKIARRSNAANSDHYFFSQKCPAIFIYTLGGPHGGYHSPDDTCEACGLGHFHHFLRLIFGLAD